MSCLWRIQNNDMISKMWLIMSVLINSLKIVNKVSRHKQRLVALLCPYVWVQKYPDGWHVPRAHTATEIDSSLTDLYPNWRPLVVCLYFLNPKPLSPWENEPVILFKQHKLRQILCIGKYCAMKHGEREGSYYSSNRLQSNIFIW